MSSLGVFIYMNKFLIRALMLLFFLSPTLLMCFYKVDSSDLTELDRSIMSHRFRNQLQQEDQVGKHLQDTVNFDKTGNITPFVKVVILNRSKVFVGRSGKTCTVKDGNVSFAEGATAADFPQTPPGRILVALEESRNSGAREFESSVGDKWSQEESSLKFVSTTVRAASRGRLSQAAGITASRDRLPDIKTKY